MHFQVKIGSLVPAQDRIRMLCLCGLGERLIDHVQLHLLTQLSEDHAPKFWQQLSVYSAEHDQDQDNASVLSECLKVRKIHHAIALCEVDSMAFLTPYSANAFSLRTLRQLLTGSARSWTHLGDECLHIIMTWSLIPLPSRHPPRRLLLRHRHPTYRRLGRLQGPEVSGKGINRPCSKQIGQVTRNGTRGLQLLL